ncbi:ATP-binding protein, partial [Streptomyces sp. NPDC002044]|uniref:ATP-binding protein n=1 Tax=Streptomyces sp. NPDC002044 TaxID=3154662 RepID=UPI003317CB74
MTDVEEAAGPDAEFSSWRGAVHAVVRALRDGGRVAVTGAWGSGKTTLLGEALDELRGGQRAVLRVTCADADRAHAFSAVAQLLSAVPPEVLAALPAGWRAVVDRLLRRCADGPAGRDETAAVRLAVAGLLGSAPGFLLAVDGVQWLDEASADVLGYAVRTVAAPRLAVVVCERARDGRGTAARLLGGHPVHVPVPALDVALTSAVVVRHGLPHRWATPVHQSCGGHRLLTETACAALARQGPGARHARVVPPAAVRAAEAWLRELPAPVRATLLVAALARQPTVALLERAGRDGAEDELRLAQAAGVLHDGPPGAVRFTARVLADAAVSLAGKAERIAAHGALAGAVADPVQVVRHRALGRRDAVDQCLAEDTAVAAGQARESGERKLSAELFLLAAELTPLSRDRLRLERYL